MTKSIDEFFDTVAASALSIKEQTKGERGPLKQQLALLEKTEKAIEQMKSEVCEIDNELQLANLNKGISTLTSGFSTLFGFESEEDKKARLAEEEVQKRRHDELTLKSQAQWVEINKLTEDQKVLKESVEIIRKEFERYGKYYFLMSVFDIDEHDAATLERVLKDLDTLVTQQESNIYQTVDRALKNSKDSFKYEVENMTRTLKSIEDRLSKANL
jgi:hypothetical protein